MLRRNLRLKTAAIVTLAGLVILAGVAVGVVRLVDMAAPGYRGELADWVGERLGQPLSIGRMDMTWGWGGPVLRLADVALLDDAGEKPVLRLEAMALQFAFLDLVRGHTNPEGVALIGPRVTARQGPDGGFRLQGLEATGDGAGFDIAEAGAWLQRVDRIRVSQGRLRVIADRLDAPIELADVDIDLSNRGPRHRLDAEARLDGAPGGRLTFDVFVLGDLGQPDAADIHAYLNADGLSAPQLRRLAGAAPADLRGGRSEVEIFADWEAGQFSGARASASVAAMTTTHAAVSRSLTPGIIVEASAEVEDGSIHLRLDRLRSEAFEAADAAGNLRLDPGTGHANGEFTELPPALVQAGMRLWRPQSFAAATVAGRVPRLALDRSRDDGWRLLAEFTDLRLRDRERGLDGGRLDGRVTLGPAGGTLRLAGGAGELAWPRYLNGTLPIADASGEIAWEPADDGRMVHLTDLRFAGLDTTVSGGGHIRLPHTGAAEADLAFQLQSENIGPVLDRIPQAEDMPNPRLRDWLPDAVPVGRIESARVRLQGPLDRFPFADGGGTFRVEAEAADVTLAYKPEWPLLEAIHGRMELVGDTLDIQARRGRMLGVTLGPATAHIPNVREPVLAVTGGVDRADAPAMLRFLPNSPLADKFGRLAEVLKVEGDAGLRLDLSVPLKPDLGELALDGAIDLAGVQLDHGVLPQPLRHIRGTVRFDRKGLYAEGLEGRFAGLPVRAGMAPSDGDALAIDASALMRLPADAGELAGLLPPAVLARAEGETRWHTQLEVLPDGQVNGLSISSDLAGLALDLPAPLGKPAAPAAPLEVSLPADGGKVHLDYANRLRADLRLADGAPVAVDLLFGADPEPAPDGPGLWLGGDLPVVDVAAWQRLAADLGSDSGDGGGSGMALRGADVRAAGVRLNGQRIGALAVRVVPTTAVDGWQATLEGDGASGTVRWLTGDQRPHVSASLQRLALQTRDTTGGDHPTIDNDGQPDTPDDGTPTDPGSLPTLDLSVSQLQVGDTSLGRFRLAANTVPGGLRLDTLSLDGDGVSLDGSGTWTRRDGASEADAELRFQGAGIERILQALGYTATLRAADADVSAELRFAPHPDGLVPSRLNGRMGFRFEDGTLVAVEPGAGRVLGLVNFYALPRRLLLDFRDVLGEGLAFDSLRGDFRIEDGDAHTDNLRINTPATTIRIAGRVGLAARDYDQRVTIVPKTSSAAAIAGTVLGGPAVGAALFVAQRLLRKPIADISSVTYHLTGSWQDPEIDPVEGDDGAS